MATSHSDSSGPNPFQAPLAGARSSAAAPKSRGQLATPQAIEMLEQTRPWVRFLSVVGFIVTALMVVIGLLGVGLGFAGNGDGIPGLALFAYIPLSLIYLFPSLFLWRYANSISRLQATHAAADLESALQEQRSFWRFVGILLALLLGLNLLLGLLAPVLMLMEYR